MALDMGLVIAGDSQIEVLSFYTADGYADDDSLAAVCPGKVKDMADLLQ